MTEDEYREYWEWFSKFIGLPRELDMIDRYVLVFKAVEVLRTQPDINYTEMSWKIGLNKTTDAGLAGWYLQVAKDIIKRQD
jgi:hypothetical protein